MAMTTLISGGGSSPKLTDGAAHVIASATGEFISEQRLTLSATSQTLTVPAGARFALIRIQGGTVTDYAYLSLDATDAVNTDYILANAQDVTANLRFPTETLIGGDLADVRILGTANASTAIIWYFK